MWKSGSFRELLASERGYSGGRWKLPDASSHLVRIGRVCLVLQKILGRWLVRDANLKVRPD